MSASYATEPRVFETLFPEILLVLKETILQCDKNPAFLHSPELQFYHEWLQGMGAKLDEAVVSSGSSLKQKRQKLTKIISEEILSVLKDTSLVYDLNPGLLHSPELQFYCEWLEGMGAKLDGTVEKAKNEVEIFNDDELSESEIRELSLFFQTVKKKDLKKHEWFDWDCHIIYYPFLKKFRELVKDKVVTESDLLKSEKYERLVTEYHNQYMALINDDDYKRIQESLEEKLKSMFHDAFQIKDDPSEVKVDLQQQVKSVVNKLLIASKAIARVSILDTAGNEGGGTGVLSTLPDKSTVLITNNHVIHDKQEAVNAEIIFEEGNQSLECRVRIEDVVFASPETLHGDSGTENMDISLLKFDDISLKTIQETEIVPVNLPIEADMLHGEIFVTEALKECEQYLLPQKATEIVDCLEKLIVGSSAASPASLLEKTVVELVNMAFHDNQYDALPSNEIHGEFYEDVNSGESKCPWLEQTRLLFVKLLTLLKKYVNQQHSHCQFGEYCIGTNVIQWLQILIVTVLSGCISSYSETLYPDSTKGNKLLMNLFKSITDMPKLSLFSDEKLGELLMDYACAVRDKVFEYCKEYFQDKTEGISIPCCKELLDCFKTFGLSIYSFVLDLVFSSLIHNLIMYIWVTSNVGYGRHLQIASVDRPQTSNSQWFDLRIKQHVSFVLPTVPVIASFWLHIKARVTESFAKYDYMESNGDDESKILADFKLRLYSVMQRFVVLIGHPHLSQKRLTTGYTACLLASNMRYSCPSCAGSSGSAVFNVRFCFPNKLFCYLAGIHVKKNIGLGLSALHTDLSHLFNNDDGDDAERLANEEQWIESTLESVLKDIREVMEAVDLALPFTKDLTLYGAVLFRSSGALYNVLLATMSEIRPKQVFLAKEGNLHKLTEIAMLSYMILMEKLLTDDHNGQSAAELVLSLFVNLILLIVDAVDDEKEVLRNGGERLLDFMCCLLKVKPNGFPEIFRTTNAALIAYLLTFSEEEDCNTDENPEPTTACISISLLSFEFKTKLENYLEKMVAEWDLNVDMTLGAGGEFDAENGLKSVLHSPSPVHQNVMLWRLAWAVINQPDEYIPSLKKIGTNQSKATAKLQELLNGERAMTAHGRKLTNIIIKQIENYKQP